MTGRAPADSTSRLRPTRWASTVVRLACRALPAGSLRERWQREFLADLEVLEPRQQATYGLGVLANAWALRSALGREESTIMETTAPTRPRLLCRLNLRHKWRVVSTEDGNPHWECIHCQKLWVSVRPPGDWSPGF
jgi:hypothetical protein